MPSNEYAVCLLHTKFSIIDIFSILLVVLMPMSGYTEVTHRGIGSNTYAHKSYVFCYDCFNFFFSGFWKSNIH